MTPCNGHFREIAQFVKNGVYEAGGVPLAFPEMSLGEIIIRPTTMLCRPEVGNMALPRKIFDKGITDMAKIPDTRMSGTAFGTVFLHAPPESAIGGNLALVQNDDIIATGVLATSILLRISGEEMQRRKAAFVPLDRGFNRGYGKLYIETPTQAHLSADLHALIGKSGNKVSSESH